MYYLFWLHIRRELARLRQEFKNLWKYYVRQTCMAGIIVFLVLLMLDMQHAVIIASIGASVFIVFAMPKNITAHPRRIIGGYLCGFITGALFALIPQPFELISFIVYSAAVGVSIFLMVMLDVEHPPASGIALGTVISGASSQIAIAVIVSSTILSLAQHFGRRFLKDLT